jgi:plasmid stabilization system protein ParE
MVEKGYEVVWTKRSQKQMRQVFKHISKDSPKNASKVILEIAEAVEKAILNPEI